MHTIVAIYRRCIFCIVATRYFYAVSEEFDFKVLLERMCMKFDEQILDVI